MVNARKGKPMSDFGCNEMVQKMGEQEEQKEQIRLESNKQMLKKMLDSRLYDDVLEEHLKDRGIYVKLNNRK